MPASTTFRFIEPAAMKLAVFFQRVQQWLSRPKKRCALPRLSDTREHLSELQQPWPWKDTCAHPLERAWEYPLYQQPHVFGGKFGICTNDSCPAQYPLFNVGDFRVVLSPYDNPKRRTLGTPISPQYHQKGSWSDDSRLPLLVEGPVCTVCETSDSTAWLMIRLTTTCVWR